MNLEAIQKHLRTVTQKEWMGNIIYLRKIGAKDGIEIFNSIKELASKDRNPAEDQMETVKFNAKIISKAMADEVGELVLDNDDGRELLAAMNFKELTELGQIVLEHSGYGGEKKSTPPSNSSPSNSAGNSEMQTAPTPTTSLAG